MVTQIMEMLEKYKTMKAVIDQRHTAVLQDLRRKSSVEYFEELRPEREQEFLKEENDIKEATLKSIETELSKVSRRVEYMLQDVRPESLAQIEALKGVELSHYEETVLLNKYRGDYWATLTLTEKINAGRSDMDKISFVHPEELLGVVADMKRDIAFIVSNYAFDMTDSGASTAAIEIQLIENGFSEYFDRLTTSYISEYEFDLPTPLTDYERNEINRIFADCSFEHEKKEKAAEAAESGKGELVSRSEFAKFLPSGYIPVVELSEEAKQLIGGTFTPGQYAGLEEIYEEGNLLNLSSAMGIGAEKVQEHPKEKAVDELKEPTEETAKRIIAEYYEEQASGEPAESPTV